METKHKKIDLSETGLEDYLTFADVAQRMQAARLECTPYLNRKKHPLEGTTVNFFYFCEWFSVNVHDAAGMPPEEVLGMLQAAPNTRLDSFKLDDYGSREYWGSARVGKHHVMVWYNPQGL